MKFNLPLTFIQNGIVLSLSFFLTLGFQFRTSAETLRLSKKCQALFDGKNRSHPKDRGFPKQDGIPAPSKVVLREFLRTDPTIATRSTKPEDAVRVTHWNLNNFLTQSFAHEVIQQLQSQYSRSSQSGDNINVKADENANVNDNVKADANIKAKTLQQLEATRDAIQALDAEIIILQEVHIGSIKEFVKEYLNHQYEVIEPSKVIHPPGYPPFEVFGTVLLKKTSFNARIVGIQFKSVAHTSLTHGLFEYRVYDPHRSAAWNENPLLIIASAHLKSLRENQSSLISSSTPPESAEARNNREIDAVQKYLAELDQGAFSKVPILFLSDANNNMADSSIRTQLLGVGFSSVRDSVHETDLYPGAEGTHVKFKNEVVGKRINPRSGKEEDVWRTKRLFSELDIIAGNSVTQQKHIETLGLSQQEYYAGFYTTTNGVVFPRNQVDRNDNYPSDHLPLTTTLKFYLPSPRF